jgi:phosphoribosylglycinamide formyltransferase-1
MLRVLCLFSGSASSLRYLVENDPNYGKRYVFVGAFCDRDGVTGITYCRDADIPIPVDVIDYRAWIRRNNVSYNDLQARAVYFTQVLDLVRKYKPDIILCSGFMLVITSNFVAAYPNRILNVHPANLAKLGEDGKPVYAGTKDAVQSAIAAGDKCTRSTIHVLTDDVDLGPAVTFSDWLAVAPDRDAKCHQEAMKVHCDGPGYAAALAMICDDVTVLDRLAA